MRRGLILTTILIVVIVLFAFSFTNSSEENMSKLRSVEISVSCDEFQAKEHITKSVKLSVHGRLEIALCSNPSTGYQWSDSAQISDHTVLWQTSHTTLPSSSSMLGAPGTEKWTFQAFNKGTTTISLEYSRPWEESGGDGWSLRVNVTVVEEPKPEGYDEQIGEELVRKVFEYIKNSNISALESMLSEKFQAVHDFGASNRQQEIETLKGIDLQEYTLDNFKVTREGQVLIVTYTISAEEIIRGEKVPKKPIPRLSVFIKTDSGWKWIAHANLS